MADLGDYATFDLPESDPIKAHQDILLEAKRMREKVAGNRRAVIIAGQSFPPVQQIQRQELPSRSVASNPSSGFHSLASPSYPRGNGANLTQPALTFPSMRGEMTLQNARFAPVTYRVVSPPSFFWAQPVAFRPTLFAAGPSGSVGRNTFFFFGRGRRGFFR